MWWQLIAQALIQNQKQTEENIDAENAQKVNEVNSIYQKRQQRQTAKNAINQEKPIDMGAIVEGVFTKPQRQQRQDVGNAIGQLKFKSSEQLIDPEDPSLLPVRELTGEAEESIISNFDAINIRKPVTLEIGLPVTSEVLPADGIINAIRNHFMFLQREHERETVIFLRKRRVSLAFAALNGIFAVIYINVAYLNPTWMASLPGIVIGGIIVILNWVTIWDSYEFFVYDGRENSRRGKILKKIVGSQIRVIQSGQST